MSSLKKAGWAPMSASGRFMRITASFQPDGDIGPHLKPQTTVPGGSTAFFGTTSTPSRMITRPFA